MLNNKLKVVLNMIPVKHTMVKLKPGLPYFDRRAQWSVEKQLLLWNTNRPALKTSILLRRHARRKCTIHLLMQKNQ